MFSPVKYSQAISEILLWEIKFFKKNCFHNGCIILFRQLLESKENKYLKANFFMF